MKTPLPTIDGVGPSCFRVTCAPGTHLIEYLAKRFPGINSELWMTRMAQGRVVDDDGVPWKPDSACRTGDYVFYYRELDTERAVPFEETVLYRDDHILAADKPHFLPVMPSGKYLKETLLVRLKRKLGLDHLVPVHRIDRETAGVVVLSHNPDTRGAYAAVFRERAATKVYEALAPTMPAMTFPVTYRSRILAGKPFFLMREVEGPPNSETTIEVIEERKGATLYRLTPHTGRKHQLRVHCAALGMPIINDGFYPDLMPVGDDDFSRPLKLLARSVSFTDPVTGRELHIASKRSLG